MKKIVLAILVAIPGFLSHVVCAQTEKQQSSDSGYNAIIPIQKQNLLKNIDVIANMQSVFVMNLPTESIPTAGFAWTSFVLK
jgi:hypothetical protein